MGLELGIWLVVIEHAQPHDFKRSNSPPMGHTFASKLGQMPHLIPLAKVSHATTELQFYSYITIYSGN